MMQGNRLHIILSAIVVAFACAYLVTPFIHRHADSDFSRTRYILEALKAPNEPEVVLFGNSILMSGVNTAILSEGNGKTIYNLGSSNQLAKASFLYYQRLPASVKKVYQFVSVTQLGHALPANPDEFLRNLVMYGYDFHAATDTLLSPSDLAYFQKNRMQVQFEARTALVQSFNYTMRRWLRKDLLLDHNVRDLHYPYMYTQRLEPTLYAKAIAKHNPPDARTVFHPHTATLAAFRRAARYLSERNIGYHIVLLPMNPDLYNITTEYKEDAVKKLAMVPDLHFIDCMNLLGSADFVDQAHMSKSGAIRLSSHLKNKMR